MINNNIEDIIMDYKKHYDLLIKRANKRKINDYKERHHIIPKCMGGVNNKTNIVELTPEEHYLAHLLLVKIYPDDYKLIHAAQMMTVGNSDTPRTNKYYGWLRRRLSIIAKQRKGNKNGSFGRRWYHDPYTLENGKFKECPCGWALGRVPNSKCIICNNDTGSKQRKYCDTHRPKPKAPCEKGYKPTQKDKDRVRQYCLSRPKEKHPQFGKRWINNGNIKKMVQKEDVQNYLNQGWNIGKK